MRQSWEIELDKIESNLLSKEYVNEMAFFKDFETLFKGEVRHNHSDFEKVDWNGLTHMHLALIKRVSALHEAEEHGRNQRAVEAYLSVPNVLKNSADGRRGHRIYTLKDQDAHYDCIGDLHGDPNSLMVLLRITGFVKAQLRGENHRLVFMGDYVDRGKAHLAILGRLLTLKCCFPNHVFLLRGNHDGGILEAPNQVKLPYRKPEDEPDEAYFPTYLIQLKGQHPEVAPLLPAYLDFFNTLGQIAFIQKGSKITMAVHGGVPRPIHDSGRYYTYLNHLSELSDCNYIDDFGRTMVQNIMWSDPYRGEGDLREGMGRFFFTEEHFTDFARTIGIDQMIRGHEWMTEGYRSHFDNCVYTIFSSGNWKGEPENDLTAYGQVQGRWARLGAGGAIEILPKE